MLITVAGQSRNLTEVPFLYLIFIVKKEVISCEDYLFSGGERGIRTLERVLAVTRFPVVRLRPAQPSLHKMFSQGTCILYYQIMKMSTPFLQI